MRPSLLSLVSIERNPIVSKHHGSHLSPTRTPESFLQNIACLFGFTRTILSKGVNIILTICKLSPTGLTTGIYMRTQLDSACFYLYIIAFLDRYYYGRLPKRLIKSFVGRTVPHGTVLFCSALFHCVPLFAHRYCSSLVLRCADWCIGWVFGNQFWILFGCECKRWIHSRSGYVDSQIQGVS